jgi:hypothetical protein
MWCTVNTMYVKIRRVEARPLASAATATSHVVSKEKKSGRVLTPYEPYRAIGWAAMRG